MAQAGSEAGMTPAHRGAQGACGARRSTGGPRSSLDLQKRRLPGARSVKRAGRAVELRPAPKERKRGAPAGASA